jgi:Site-specific recombinase XerD
MEHLEAFLGYLRNNRRFTEHTIIAYRNDLLRFAEYLEQNDLLLSPK